MKIPGVIKPQQLQFAFSKYAGGKEEALDEAIKYRDELKKLHNIPEVTHENPREEIVDHTPTDIDYTKETWKVITEFPKYKISDCGEIFTGSMNEWDEKKVVFGGKLKYVKQLVASEFNLPNTENKKFILHKNKNKHDNRLENLYYADNDAVLANRPVQANNVSGVTGLVLPSGKNKFYLVKRSIRGKKIKETFTIKKYGEENAKKLALEKLMEFVKEHGDQSLVTQLEEQINS